MREGVGKKRQYCLFYLCPPRSQLGVDAPVSLCTVATGCAHVLLANFGSVHKLVGKMGSFLLRFGKNTQFVTEQIESDATENDGGLNLVMSHPCQNLYLYFTYFTNHPVNATNKCGKITGKNRGSTNDR